jgi:hypothetical protein
LATGLTGERLAGVLLAGAGVDAGSTDNWPSVRVSS